MKTFLITGVDKGIGRALMEACLEQGHRVIGTVYASSSPFTHSSFTPIQLDLASLSSIEQCAEDVQACGESIDVLINNAGVLLDEDETRVKVDKLRQTLEVNLIGTIDLTERLVPQMRDGGHIVNISSTAGSLGLVMSTGASHRPHHYPSYKISKAALNMYTRTLAEELRDRQIIVSSIHPGWVKTDMGGPQGERTPEQAAEALLTFALSHPPTGQFWFAGKRFFGKRVEW